MYKKIAQVVKSGTHFLFTSGAGMGVDSGLPDFRGPEGFWRAYPPFEKLGFRFEEMSNPSWFKKDPEIAWGFFGHRYQLYNSTEPHEGFAILRNITKDFGIKKNNHFIITSNVDGHFHKAQFKDDRIYEIHGSINYLQPVKGLGVLDNSIYIWEAKRSLELRDLQIDMDNIRAITELPYCPHNKNELARPNILMFQDYSFNSHRTMEQNMRFYKWYNNVLKMEEDHEDLCGNDKHLVVIEIGAGKFVPSIRNTSENMVKSSGKEGMKSTLIRINPRDGSIPKSPKGCYNDLCEFMSVEEGGLSALKNIQDELY